jgi:hypothetical protein
MQNEGMKFRRNKFDVTNTVDVTDPVAVGQALEDIFLGLYPDADAGILQQAVRDIAGLYRGEHPDYAACDTGYHDLQHVLDVTLASARLMGGYECNQQDEMALGRELFLFGVLMALFHDSGYLRRRGIEDDRQGAEFTQIHVSRSAELLKHYLLEHGMGDLAETGARLVHLTGYEIPPEQVTAPSPLHRLVGNLVATADMLAQMSDRCYLEKCHDRLYNEFILGGIARKRDEQGNEQVIFASPQDLVIKTPGFYRSAKKRMDETLGSVYHYAERYFGGQNLYLETIERNIKFAEYITTHGADIGMLQRSPPQTPGSDHGSAEADERKQYVEDRRQRIADRRQNRASLYPDFVDRRQIKGDRRSRDS